MDQERSKTIIQALSRKGVNKACPRCGHLHFNVVAETSIPINDDPKVITSGGPVVPTVIVACNNCGFLTQHALGALDLVPEEAAHAG
jgi:ribosomal protein S27AE